MATSGRTCTAKLKLAAMTKTEYKQVLLDYIDKQIDKLTVKQIRVLITSYASKS
jgi:hypothetical protein